MFITICHKLFLVNGSQWLISWNSTLIHGFHQMYFFLDWHSIFHQVALFLWDWPDYPTIYTNLCYRFPTRFELTCGYWTNHFLNHKQVLQVIRLSKRGMLLHIHAPHFTYLIVSVWSRYLPILILLVYRWLSLIIKLKLCILILKAIDSTQKSKRFSSQFRLPAFKGYIYRFKAWKGDLIEESQ